MADEKVKLSSEMASVSDAMAYSANFAAFRPGITPQESTAIYEKWAESGQYEKMLWSFGVKVLMTLAFYFQRLLLMSAEPQSNARVEQPIGQRPWFHEPCVPLLQYHWDPRQQRQTYPEDVNRERYKGPVIAAEAVGEFFPSGRAEVLIIDVASGTGFVGEELWKLGFRRMHALDPSEGMLELARQKKIYEKEYRCYLGTNLLHIEDNEYDCAVTAGGMGEGHIPISGLAQLARIVKPGGLVCIVKREEYLEHVAEYRGRLENTGGNGEHGFVATPVTCCRSSILFRPHRNCFQICHLLAIICQ